MKVRDIAETIEAFAPLPLQEDYDNAGLQVGRRDMNVTAVLLCLDVTPEVLEEATRRNCNMIVSHHPLIFRGLKSLTGDDTVQQVAIEALRRDVAIYSAHTNLDSTWNGVSHEMAHKLGLTDVRVLHPAECPGDCGDGQPMYALGVVGDTEPTPALEFLRKVKEKFGVKCLRYSEESPKLVVKRVALCGGSGASFVKDAVKAGADIFVTGDVKYHDFTTWARDIILADIGHYESECCSASIFSRVLRERFPSLVVYFSESQKNPIGFI